uniref:PDZ domain-containing protein n=1 Tax=Meloidogyne incognita TaxID=6306 RepID=A0A914LR67_MELIC
MFSSTGSVKLVSMDAGYKSTILYLAFLIVCFIMVTIEQKIEENNYMENDDDIFVTSNLEENEKNNIFDGKNNDVDSSNGGWNDNNDELFYLLKQNNCTIERIDGTQLGQDDFLRRNLIYWLIGAIFLLFWLQPILTVETTFGLYLQKYLKPLNINIPANGIDQFTGVFVSRFGENSELEKCGDICRPGDQILAVNNVPVKEMGIDDVVLMLSIPRRLLLRTSFLNSQREQFASRQQQRFLAECAATEQRPVVVFQKSTESDRRDSESSGAGILSKPASTAASWLGKRVRQQQKQKKQQEEDEDANQKNEITNSQQQQTLIRHRQYPQTTNYQQQQQPSTSSTNIIQQQHPPPHSITDGITQTARIPPPRIMQQQQLQSSKQNSPLLSSSNISSIPPYISHLPAYSSATLDSRWQEKQQQQQRHPSSSAPIQRRQRVVVFGGENVGGGGGGGMIPNSLSQQQMPPIIPPAPISSNLPLYKQHSPFQNTIPSQLYCIRQPATLPTSYKSNSLPRRRVIE